MNNEKILITGGSGLIGSALKFDNCIKLSSKDCDLRNTQKTFELSEKINPDKVIHCAARVGGVLGNRDNKGLYYYDNIMINTNVLEASRRVGVKKVLSVLSTCIFPKNAILPLTENQINLGEPHNAHYSYAYAKRMVQIQSRAYNEQYGVNYVSVVPSNIYGPRDSFNLENGHVLPSLLHKCYLAKRDNTDFIVWGSGTPMREFIYSEDIARMIERLLYKYNEIEPVILSPMKETSIKELVDIIVNKFNFKGKVVFDRDKPDGQYRKLSDNSKLLSYLPDFEFTPLEKGIEKTINWMVDNYEEMRK